MKLALWAIGSLLLLHMFGVVGLPVWGLMTLGEIYVDSPEVYTRERLVNDRYEQDFWLRSQLSALNDVTPEDLAQGRFYARAELKAELGASQADALPRADDEGGSGDENREERVAPNELSFRDRFEVLSGIRDMVRQQILENMLDDRHDLTANSVYGFKFDTTVIPGNNTRKSAFVEVKLEPECLFQPLRPKKSSDEAGTDCDAKAPDLPMEDYVLTFLCRKERYRQRLPAACEHLTDVGVDLPAALKKYQLQQAHYLAWLEDVEKRLNSVEESLFKSISSEDPNCPDAAAGVRLEHYEALLAGALEVVLNLPEKRFELDHADVCFISPCDVGPDAGEDTPPTPYAVSGPVRLPSPYRSYMLINTDALDMGSDSECRWRVNFVVEEVEESFIARPIPPEPVEGGDDATVETPASTTAARGLPPGRPYDAHADWVSATLAGLPGAGDAPADALRTWVHKTPVGCGGATPIWQTRDGAWQFLKSDWLLDYEYTLRSDFGMLYEMPSEALRLYQDVAVPSQDVQCTNLLAPGDVAVRFPAGFFNFIDSMRELDAYSYAVFPKNDVRGILADRAVQGVAGGGGLGLDVFQRRVQSTTEPELIGYGRGERSAQRARAVRFGWVIAAQGQMRPSLKTQLALVSVPAWTDTLQMRVTTGWLNWRGRRTREHSFDMTVRLPPDYEAFDSIFRNRGWVSPAPRIRDEAMDKAIYVIAGEEARVLIPGTRLWRSTAVTLGAQPASRIRVLPNMEGIIAEFREVAMPFARYNPRPASGEDEAALSGEADAIAGSPAPANPCPLDTGADGQLVGLAARPVRLRVWTSEGVAEAVRPACIVYDPKRQITDRIGVPDTGPAAVSGD